MQPSLASICHSYRWLDKDKERELAAHCVFLWELMSALDQKSREATLAFGQGVGAHELPPGQASEDPRPLIHPIPLATRQRHAAEARLPSTCLSGFSLLFLFLSPLQKDSLNTCYESSAYQAMWTKWTWVLSSRSWESGEGDISNSWPPNIKTFLPLQAQFSLRKPLPE